MHHIGASNMWGTCVASEPRWSRVVERCVNLFEERQSDPTYIVGRHIPNLFDSHFGVDRWGKPWQSTFWLNVNIFFFVCLYTNPYPLSLIFRSKIISYHFLHFLHLLPSPISSLSRWTLQLSLTTTCVILNISCGTLYRAF